MEAQGLASTQEASNDGRRSPEKPPIKPTPKSKQPTVKVKTFGRVDLDFEGEKVANLQFKMSGDQQQ